MSMRKYLCLLFAILMTLSLCACNGEIKDGQPEGTATAAKTQLEIGFGKVNTTPSYSVTLIGSSVNGDRYSNGIISYLYATCIAAKYGDEIYLIYTVDILSLADGMTQVLRDEITSEV